MSVMVVLISASMIVAIGFLAAFLWAVRSGQYDDSYTPSVRILMEDHRRTDDDQPEDDSNQGEETNGR